MSTLTKTELLTCVHHMKDLINTYSSVGHTFSHLKNLNRIVCGYFISIWTPLVPGSHSNTFHLVLFESYHVSVAHFRQTLYGDRGTLPNTS